MKILSIQLGDDELPAAVTVQLDLAEALLIASVVGDTSLDDLEVDDGLLAGGIFEGLTRMLDRFPELVREVGGGGGEGGGIPTRAGARVPTPDLLPTPSPAAAPRYWGSGVDAD